ncbi:rRNA maturation RNase YbeY [Candidatus Gottesmanbacteria bacterium]|nr:rRNA maturation RNase YbeY [Candidatus Gottesmanbacteria bacterium]
MLEAKMVNVLIKSESRYPVSRTLIREIVEKILSDKKMKGDIEVSVNIVGDRLMKTLNKKYRNLDTATDVLSFSQTEIKKDAFFVNPPDEILRLGDIVVSYPQAIEAAVEEEKMVDQKISELVEHGLLHLLGYHHE